MVNYEYLLLVHFGLAIIAGVLTARTSKSQAFCVFFLVLLIPVCGLLLWVAGLFFGGSRRSTEDYLSSLFALPVVDRPFRYSGLAPFKPQVPLA